MRRQTLAGRGPEKIQHLLQRYSQRQLSARLGVSHQAVSTFCKLTGLAYTHGKTRSASERQARTMALAEQGVSVCQIAEGLGVGVATVRRYLHQAHVPLPRPAPRLKGLTREQVQECLNAGELRVSLARRLGVSPQAAYAFCSRHGLSIQSEARAEPIASTQQALPTFRL